MSQETLLQRALKSIAFFGLATTATLTTWASVPLASDLVRQASAGSTTQDSFIRPAGLAGNAGAAGTSALAPSQLIATYGVPAVAPAAGVQRAVVTVVVAYHYANLQADVNAFRLRFGFAPIALSVTNLAGTVSNSAWAFEETIDVELIGAVCPNCQIRVVEAKSRALPDVMNAVLYANSLNSQVVAMSFGAPDLPTSGDFVANFSNTSTVYVAAAGDINSVSFPASLPNVLAIGGSTLTSTSTPNSWTSSAWSSGGGGPSLYVAKPRFQTAITSSGRGTPDLALMASPGVYTVFNRQITSAGGTSVAAALGAGIFGLVAQARLNLAKPSMTTVQGAVGSAASNRNALAWLYSSAATSSLADIVKGTDGRYVAQVGYDFATGLGSPKVTNLVNALSQL